MHAAHLQPDERDSTPNELPSVLGHPTLIRHGVLAFAVAMAVILYLDRMAIAVAVPAIAKDLHLRVSEVADSVAAFFWCYALFQIPAGWLGDRWGGRRALTLYVAAWSLAIAGLGLAGGLASLIIMRALLGIGQAGAYATTASFLRRWIPFSRRGLANSAVSLGGRAGNVLAPTLTSALMTLVTWCGWNSGRWRPVFFAYAVVGFLWAWFFWRWFRDDPRQHTGCNAAEIALIDSGPDDSEPDDRISAADTPSAVEPAVGPLPYRALVANRDVQFLGLANFCINVGWIFVGTWLPTYMMSVHGKSEFAAGLAASLTAAAGMAGCLCGGWVTDWFVPRLGLCWGRRLPAIVSYCGAALAYAACWALADVDLIVAALVAASFLGDFASGAMWATFQDIGGSFSGTVFGWGNMCGNIGAACSISLIGRLVDHNRWSDAFILASIAYVAGAIAWLMIDPRRRIRATSPNPPAD